MATNSEDFHKTAEDKTGVMTFLEALHATSTCFQEQKQILFVNATFTITLGYSDPSLPQKKHIPGGVGQEIVVILISNLSGTSEQWLRNLNLISFPIHLSHLMACRSKGTQ